MKIAVSAAVMVLALPLAAAPPQPIVDGVKSSKDIGLFEQAPVGTLARAVACKKKVAAAPGAELPDGCELQDEIGAFAASADGGALLTWGAETKGSCGDDYEGWTIRRRPVQKGKLLAGEVVAKSPPCAEDTDPDACRVQAGPAALEALARLSAEGWRDLPELARGTLDRPAGIQSYQPAAVLGAPFDGWMLYLKEENTRNKVLLVAPDNLRSISLATLKCSQGFGSQDEDGNSVVSWDCFGSVERVALAPDRASLLLTASFHDGGHCSPSKVRIERLWLPKEAQALLAPPPTPVPAPAPAKTR